MSPRNWPMGRKFVVGTLVVTLAVSVSASSVFNLPPPALSSRWYERMLRLRELWPAVRLSVTIALLSTAVSLVLGSVALFHFTHDVLREPQAIANVLAHLKPGARVVASGLQWAPPWVWPTNVFVLGAAMYSVTSLEGLSQPWDKLAAYLRDVEVQSALMGGIYIASGVVR